MNQTQNYRVRIGEMGAVTEPVYLCRCGETHEGDYAIYEYGQHMCFHDAPLMELPDQYVICPDCGKGWATESFERTAAKSPRPRWQQILEYLKALYR